MAGEQRLRRFRLGILSTEFGCLALQIATVLKVRAVGTDGGCHLGFCTSHNEDGLVMQSEGCVVLGSLLGGGSEVDFGFSVQLVGSFQVLGLLCGDGLFLAEPGDLGAELFRLMVGWQARRCFTCQGSFALGVLVGDLIQALSLCGCGSAFGPTGGECAYPCTWASWGAWRLFRLGVRFLCRIFDRGILNDFSDHFGSFRLSRRRLHSSLGYHSPMAFEHLPDVT